MKKINIGILGLGTVGGGTALVLQRNAKEIQRRIGVELSVTMASVRDLQSDRLCDTAEMILTVDPYEIVNNSQIDVVVELIGGDTLAKELVLMAIANGKHVVTANKALIALHGNEIFKAAEQYGVSVSFEASVAGGISIIKGIREGLAGNTINMVAGIINGTGNFILTEMRDKARSFDDVLQEAQALGYAEADPTFDVEGIDATHKLTILASIAFGIPLSFEKIYTQGITDVSLIDVNFAQELGYRIKHLGIAKRTGKGIELRVHPTLISQQQLLAHVDGVMNAVMVKGDAVGETLQYGPGAGAEPTASAVVADIIDLSRTMHGKSVVRVPHLAFQHDELNGANIVPIQHVESAYYIRVQVNDVAGVMSQLSASFAELGVSIEGITQKEPAAGESIVSVIFITQRTTEQLVDDAIAKLAVLKDVSGDVVKLRVEHFH